MNLKLTAVVAGAALAASLAFTSFVPAASAQAVPPMLGPAMRFLQNLEQQLKGLSNTVAGFAKSFTTQQLEFTRGQGNEIDVQTLCIGSTCIAESQLQALLANLTQPAATPPALSSSALDATDTPPVIQVNGDNPAIIQVGATYSDLGATIEGPQADLNLGITTYVNGTQMDPVQLDTSTAATDTIDYVATDQSGLAATSTRTVIVGAPATDNTAASSTAASSTPSI